MAKFTIAVNRYYKDSAGTSKQEVMFIGIDAWGTLGKNCLTYLTKGRGVRVVGRLRQDRWNDREGAYRDRIYVVAEHVEFKRDRNKSSNTSQDEVSGDEETVPF